jgi:hypothetical protein
MDEDNKPAEVEDIEAKLQPKKRRKWPWVVSILILLFIVVPVIVLGYLGFIPGLSSLMGATKARDLGVRYSEADYLSYQTKTGGQFLDYANAPASPLNPAKKTIFGDPKYMDVDLTQEEITATINMVGWSWMPLTNTQVRFGDGVVEMSGNLNMNQLSNFVNFIGGVGYSKSDVDKALGWGKRLAGNPPVYIRAAASMTNNVLSMEVQQVRIGRFDAPIDIASKVLNTGTNNALNGTYGLNTNGATFSNGQLHFTGTSPTKVYVKRD